MKKIFAGFFAAVFILSAGLALAQEVKQPQLPVGLDQFRLIREGNGRIEDDTPCGKLRTYVYDKNPEATWYAMFLNKEQFPNPFLVDRVERNSREDWVDNNRDGIFDKRYTDYDALHNDYPTPCDAVKN